MGLPIPISVMCPERKLYHMAKYRIISLLLAFVLFFQAFPNELSMAEGWSEVVSADYRTETRHSVVFFADNKETASLYVADGNCLSCVSPVIPCTKG